MPRVIPDRVRQIHQRLLDELVEEYETLAEQYAYTVGDRQRLLLDREMESLQRRIEEIEAKMCQVGESGQANNSRYLHWERYLPEIDFTEAVDIVETVVERFEQARGGGALLLLQNAHPMGGRWCVERVKRLLNRTADFKPFEIVFAPGDRVDEWTLLTRLGEYVACDPPPIEGAAEINQKAVQTYAQAIRQKVLGSLQSGSVVYIELQAWDNLALENRLMPWFIHNLWGPLVQQLPEIIPKHPLVNFVSAIVVQPPVSEGYLCPDLCCTQAQLDSEKILELPLRPWTPDEIQQWLLRYGGLTAPPISLEVRQIEQMAYEIHRGSSDGRPIEVYTALMNRLDQIFSNYQEDPV